jgi:hypothetical protein
MHRLEFKISIPKLVVVMNQYFKIGFTLDELVAKV